MLISNLMRQVCGDFLDLVEDEGHDPDSRARDYATLKDAVRSEHQVPIHNLEQLYRNVLDSIPENVRESPRKALDAYVDAASEEIIVQENAAYILGVAVGKAFGARARLRKPW